MLAPSHLPHLAPCSYMSPEVFIKDLVSPALDIYSLGIICEENKGRQGANEFAFLLVMVWVWCIVH